MARRGDRPFGTRSGGRALAALGNLASDLLAIGAGISWAASAVLAKWLRARRSIDLLSLTAWQMLFGALILTLIAVLVPSRPTQWTPEFVAMLLYNVVPATAGAWLAWLHLLHRLSAGAASLSVLLVPVVGLLASRMQLDERPGTVELSGMILIGSGLLLLYRAGTARRLTSAPSLRYGRRSGYGGQLHEETWFFHGLCGRLRGAALFRPRVKARLRPRLYRRALLVDAHGYPAARPFDCGAAQLHLPLPLFRDALLPTRILGSRSGNPTTLKTADARSYDWPGGVGPQRAIVAYSAICAHKLAYPTKEISFISYRAELTPHSKLARVIHCCSEHSQYDPAAGGRVLAGPAPQPLAAILLEHDTKRTRSHALGTLGGEMFNDFFAKYGFRLTMELGADRVRREAGERVKVSEMDSYCRQQVKC
ncbi:MAG: EamA family transporter [Comamonadaceae bacterium]|nr:EamA family transporter [Comamonadaceae bacterium]